MGNNGKYMMAHMVIHMGNNGKYRMAHMVIYMGNNGKYMIYGKYMGHRGNI